MKRERNVFNFSLEWEVGTSNIGYTFGAERINIQRKKISRGRTFKFTSERTNQYILKRVFKNRLLRITHDPKSCGLIYLSIGHVYNLNYVLTLKLPSKYYPLISHALNYNHQQTTMFPKMKHAYCINWTKTYYIRKGEGALKYFSPLYLCVFFLS